MVFKVYGHMFPNPQRNIVNVLNSNFAFIQERDKIKEDVKTNVNISLEV